MPKNQDIIHLENNTSENSKPAQKLFSGFSGLDAIRKAIQDNLNQAETPVQPVEPAPVQPQPIAKPVEEKADQVFTQALPPQPEKKLQMPHIEVEKKSVAPAVPQASAPLDISTKDFADRLYPECHARMALVADDVENARPVNPTQLIKIIPQLCKTIAASEYLFMRASAKKRDGSWIVSHSVNVTIVAVKIALGMHFEPKKQYELALTAFLHDLGMMKIPQKIVTKQGRLTDEEYVSVKAHPEYSRSLVQHLAPKFPFLPVAVYQEQERNDGTGYPLGIKGNEINEYARIIAVADVFEALVHGRAYREGFLSYTAIKTLLEQKAKQFDAAVVKGFIDVISMYPVGSMVQLNTLEIAQVISVNKRRPVRPVVKVVKDADGIPVSKSITINLEMEPLLYITKPVDF